MEEIDIDELTQDIHSAISELGNTGDNQSILWKKVIPSNYDKVYNEDVSLAYRDFEVSGVYWSLMDESKLSMIGSKEDKYRKLCIARYSFENAKNIETTELESIIPKEEDKLVKRGVLFNVTRIRPLELGDKNFVYLVYVEEANLSEQPEKYREKKQPYFEPDSSQDENQTNDTGANDNIYSDKPAKIVGSVIDTYDITPGYNDKFLFSINGSDGVEVTLSSGTDISAEIIADEIQSVADTEIGVGRLIADDNNGYVELYTNTKGEEATLEILDIANNCYVTLGFEVGEVTGEHSMDVVDDGDYDDDGNPI
jgi:hypothetical protein